MRLAIPKSLQRLRQNLSIVPIVDTAVSQLIQNGVFTFLRERAVPIVIDNGESVNKMAASAAFSAGYNACLDDLINFREHYILTEEKPQNTNADYGAVEASIKSGNLTKEEADAIRANKQFDANTAIAATNTDFAEFQRKRAEHNARTGN